MHGAVTTFVRVFEIHVDAVPQSLPARTHAGEFRLVGRASTVDALADAARAAVALAGGVPVTVFSMADVLALAAPVRTVCETLRAAGIAAIVQVPIDTVEDIELVVADARTAGVEVLTLGIDALEESGRLQACRRAFELQSALGGFKAFAPLPRTASVTRPSTGYDDVKQVALARLVASNIPSIQVDWALYGPKLAQVALTVGADDVDNVAAVDPGVLGTRRSPLEEIKGNISAAALEPVERDAMFRQQAGQP
jgi:aminodeoxyfutalosine synthase